MPAFIDLTGQTFGRWAVVRRAPNKGAATRWWCKCVCGTERSVDAWSLVKGISQSCGCLMTEVVRRRNTTHGLHSLPEYGIWCHIKGRCLNPTDDSYDNYGGRGIVMCIEWQTSFLAFYSDMGTRPSTKHTIERLDNSGPYSKENCVWLPARLQARNTRNNHMITLDGQTACLAEWLERKHMLRSTYKERLKRGWSIEKALTTSVCRVSQRKSHRPEPPQLLANA